MRLRVSSPRCRERSNLKRSRSWSLASSLLLPHCSSVSKQSLASCEQETPSSECCERLEPRPCRCCWTVSVALSWPLSSGPFWPSRWQLPCPHLRRLVRSDPLTLPRVFPRLTVVVPVWGSAAPGTALPRRGGRRTSSKPLLPHRESWRASPSASKAVRFASSLGLSTPGVAGVHFALDRGQDRATVPVRSILLGSILAVALVMSTLTFGSGLSTLVSHPALYGWEFGLMHSISTSDVPPQTISMVNHDPDIVSSTGVSFIELRIDGDSVPALADTQNHPTLSPPILSGRTIEHRGEIVLGAETLAQLHKHLGDTVSISYGTKSDYPVYIPPTPLRIVGVATLPAVGYPSFIQDHPSMGTGAFLSQLNAPASFLKATEQHDPELNGPSLVFVQLKTGLGPNVGLANVRHLAADANELFTHDPNELGNDVSVLGVQHPAEIVNYRSIGATPVLLAGGLGAGSDSGALDSLSLHPFDVGDEISPSLRRSVSQGEAWLPRWCGKPQSPPSLRSWSEYLSASHSVVNCGRCSPSRSTRFPNQQCRRSRLWSWVSGPWCLPTSWRRYPGRSRRARRPQLSCESNRTVHANQGASNLVEAKGLEPSNLLTASQALYQLSYAPSGGR